MGESERFRQHALCFTEVKHETDKAYLFKFDDETEEWVPKSQLKNREEFEGSQEGLIVLPQWLIEEKGLEGYIEDYDV